MCRVLTFVLGAPSTESTRRVPVSRTVAAPAEACRRIPDHHSFGALRETCRHTRGAVHTLVQTVAFKRDAPRDIIARVARGGTASEDGRVPDAAAAARPHHLASSSALRPRTIVLSGVRAVDDELVHALCDPPPRGAAACVRELVLHDCFALTPRVLAPLRRRFFDTESIPKLDRRRAAPSTTTRAPPRQHRVEAALRGCFRALAPSPTLEPRAVVELQLRALQQCNFGGNGDALHHM